MLRGVVLKVHERGLRLCRGVVEVHVGCGREGIEGLCEDFFTQLLGDRTESWRRDDGWWGLFASGRADVDAADGSVPLLSHGSIPPSIRDERNITGETCVENDKLR